VRLGSRGTTEVEFRNLAEIQMMAMWLGRRIGAVTVRGLGFILAVVGGPMAALDARGQTPAGPILLDQLLRMTPEELESVYRQGTFAAIPPGRVRGTALLAPGTRRTRLLARGTRLVWQGKEFDPAQATTVNRFFGLRMIRAQVYQAPSWLDGAPALVLDYSQTSRIYASYRDEIRQVAPGLFLGLMYDRSTAPPRLSMYFALQE
jgi:hypothetical protein